MQEHRHFDEVVERYFTFNASSYSHGEHVGHTRAIISAGNDLLRALGESVPSNQRDLSEAALWALDYFEATDRANAQIHCAPVRYSPVTFRLARALRTYAPDARAVIEVCAVDGAYAEDPGR
jgi:hypothetical protein